MLGDRIRVTFHRTYNEYSELIITVDCNCFTLSEIDILLVVSFCIHAWHECSSKSLLFK